MGNKLYVGNLDYSVTATQLQELFGAIGQVVSATVICDRETNRSKGFAFVEMGTDALAEAAIESLNGQDFQGQPLTVAEARPPRDDRARGAGGYSRRPGDRRGGGGRSGRY
jgi:cold-inducible RNA-binding protein